MRSISAIRNFADPLRLNVGSHEDRADDASVKARRSNDAAAKGGNKDRAFADQLQNGGRAEAMLDPFDDLVCVIPRICLAQCAQNDGADFAAILFARRADAAIHESLHLPGSR
ncbi:hypothetical protein ACVWZ3_006678 [Bradyrhizobium sp. i1.3.6]